MAGFVRVVWVAKSRVCRQRVWRSPDEHGPASGLISLCNRSFERCEAQGGWAPSPGRPTGTAAMYDTSHRELTPTPPNWCS